MITSPSNIPEEAVEAAGEFLPPVWTSNEVYRAQLIQALEAAAQHMLAAVDVEWGVRDTDPRVSSVVAAHPTEESARATVAEHPDWYEVVSRPQPEPEPQWKTTP